MARVYIEGDVTRDLAVKVPLSDIGDKIVAHGPACVADILNQIAASLDGGPKANAKMIEPYLDEKARYLIGALGHECWRTAPGPGFERESKK